ncbi:MAG: hypothetical protein ACPLYF_04145 [Fervidobacterium sp.]|jgi:hypothetical protein
MDITQELKDLLEGTGLSEDTLIKLKLMIEQAIQARTASLQEEIEAVKSNAALQIETIKEKADEYAQYVINEMSEKVDAYAEYVVEKFIEENKAALIEQQEYNRMKDVFEGVKRAFEVGMFKLDESAGVAELQAKLADITEAYNNLFEETASLRKQLTEQQYAMVFESLTKDLADTQREKISKLIENVSFASIDEFKRGVELMIEEIIVPSKKEQLNEEVTSIAKSSLRTQPQFDDKMKQYLSHL